MHTFIIRAKLLPQAVHLCITIPVGDFATQRQRCRSIVVRLMGGLGLLAHQSILLVVGETDLRADHHHQLGHHLGVVDEDGFYGAVQHANAQCSLFATILEHILVSQQIVAEIAAGLQPDALLLFLVGEEEAVFGGCIRLTLLFFI